MRPTALTLILLLAAAPIFAQNQAVSTNAQKPKAIKNYRADASRAGTGKRIFINDFRRFPKAGTENARRHL